MAEHIYVYGGDELKNESECLANVWQSNEDVSSERVSVQYSPEFGHSVDCPGAAR